MHVDINIINLFLKCLYNYVFIPYSDDEKIIQMYETVLNHSGNWERAKTTHIVCKIAGEDSPIKITNDPKGAGNKHAEKKLIKKLKEKNKGERLEITIYINNSPCSDSKHKCTKN